MEQVLAGLAVADRGKLIMACGTGKTFTGLKIAEAQAGHGGRVLFLVPSLSLLSQTLTEWTQESEIPLHSFAVCSDSDVGKKRKKDDDTVQTFVHELRYPATTEPRRLALEMEKRYDAQHMSVVFGTYHSINVISQAQQLHGLGSFDLIICDEAHRTTGATFGDEDESAFVKVHDGSFLDAVKRLYMTATPRIYGELAKASAEKESVALCSMDDVSLYGEELHVISFSEAVTRDLLVDYKVIVLAVEEAHVSRRIQSLLKDENNTVKVDDAAKIVGCWKALSKQGLAENLVGDGDPMKRAVAFCQVIEVSKGAKTHKVSSKNIAGMFQTVVETYQASAIEEDAVNLRCEAEHVDGSMNASEKESKLVWLKEESPTDTCRILSNVRCLSEGVDVPALDAVLFLAPRNSQVDVVQSVGRVMRNAPGKKRGYVVLPVVIPAGVEPHEALNDNKTYKVVWQVLQALRSHDDRFDAMVNKLDLIGKDVQKMEVIAITDKLDKKQRKADGSSNQNAGKGTFSIGTPSPVPIDSVDQGSLQFEIGDIERAIYAKLVQKVGNRAHWEDWANDIAKIARTHIGRISTLLEDPANVRERQAFNQFAAELRDDLNGTLTDSEIIEMLAQHLITKPVFDALFEDYSFASKNPMSLAMQNILEVLHEQRLDKEADTLQGFYESVKLRAEGINTATGKQKIVVELYDNFFRNAFPRMTERLGIVYTPVEVVDFIIHSIAYLLQAEFGQTIGDDGVHILDPFTGTGTFITRLLQSNLMSRSQLISKYGSEIHANEIVLLAYYIAAINIESTFHAIAGGGYEPFHGICLTDTFQMYEKEDLISALLEDNSSRRKRQKKLDIRVIIGNPPYSVGQKDDNDEAANLRYPSLDARIQSTYVRESTGNPRSLYDSYIRAIRWASDRVGDQGVIGFVTNAGFVDGKAADGVRKCLAKEFSSIWIFHLRGNQRTAGELSRKEGGKIFGGGSRAPIAITLLVKNPSGKNGQIFYHDIGDYLTREEKLAKIASYSSITGIDKSDGWKSIVPDRHGDWLGQRDSNFEQYIPMGDKSKSGNGALFMSYSSGVKTNRDAWAYNSSKSKLLMVMKKMISFYNQAIDIPEPVCLNDPTLIGWSWVLRERYRKKLRCEYKETKVRVAMYRPFDKRWLYYDGFFNENRYKMPQIFPDNEESVSNLMIVVKQGWKGVGQLALMVNQVIDVQSDGGTQCFPLYLYRTSDSNSATKSMQLDIAGSDISEGSLSNRRRDGISDEALTCCNDSYPGEEIKKDDIFYYIYGVLHSSDYRNRFMDNLAKELPRIPFVKSVEDFWQFCQAGRSLASLHLNYESVKMYPATIDVGNRQHDEIDYRVTKMRHAKAGKEKDLGVILYNNWITISGVPVNAYEYVVNGKSAIEWIMERQCVKTDKGSGIVNDANDWASEAMENPRYPLELLLRVITVSIDTIEIVNGLPALDI